MNRGSSRSEAQDIRRAARTYATAKNAMILWGMGVSQHVHGTDNVRCLAFCYTEAAANLLTNPALDPFAKIPELKFCAARIALS